MFNFMDMCGNHEERKVDSYNDGTLFVDTCMVTDSDQPYETAVEHPFYNKGSMVIVELYPTKEKAQKGHDKWLSLMQKKKLPKELKDISTCSIAQLCKALGNNEDKIFEKEEVTDDLSCSCKKT